MKFLLVGVDHGPYETLTPLGNNAAFSIFKFSGHPVDWRDLFRSQNFDGVILSTSRSNAGAQLELECILAANHLNLFTAVIEDYHFNFQANSALKVNLLLVENQKVRDEYINKFENSIDAIHEGALVRYSSIAHQDCNLVSRGSNVLWIGQPETSPSIEVLKQMLPILQEANIVLHFKAHPRDDGYALGSYRDLFTRFGKHFIDVSDLPIPSCIALAPSLLITRFSSLAITAGYFGIPSLHILYNEIEKDYYKKMYSDRFPVICELGASFLISSKNDQKQELFRAIFDENARNTVFQNFNKYYRIDEHYCKSVIDKIFTEASRFKNEKSSNTH